MKLVYPAIFIPCEDMPGYTVDIPDLPGCVTQGSSLAEAIEMGVDAASGWILGELEEGNKIPLPSDLKDVHPEDAGSFVTLLLLDMDVYSEQHGSKTVRKNITIPAWLNAYGEMNNINFSKVLQDSLFKMAESGK